MKNQGTIITTRTVTYAMMASKQLGRQGIRSRIVRPPADKQLLGCAYGVEIDARRTGEAREILSRAGIPFSI